MFWNILRCGIIGIMLAHSAAAPSPGESSGRSRRRTPVVEVFEQTRDSVVNIAATQIVRLDSGSGWLGEFFDLPGIGRRRKRYERTHLGSGFILHPEGYVVTNAHVVARAAKLKVIFADGAEHEAEPVAIDEKHDLAVLHIKAKEQFPAIKLGRSDDLMIGETVIAIGNPLGYEHTVTAGIISATNRKMTFSRDVIYERLIQTDASINPGSSGGPLLNVLGELIGINTAIRGDAQNIGFAIPVDALRKLLPEMLSIEQRKRLRLGLRLSWRGPVHVVEASGPAAAAGIEPGDALISVDGKPIRTDVDFYIHLLRIGRDDRMVLELERDGKRVTATLTPKPIPIPDGTELLRRRFGLTVRLLTKKEARALDVDGRLFITQVERGSPADRAGFVPGLIIVQIGRYLPSDLEDVGLLLEKVKRGNKVTFKVYEVQPMFIRVLTGSLVAR